MFFPDSQWNIATPESQGVRCQFLQSSLDILNRNCKSSDGIKRTVVARNGYIIYQGSEASVKNNTFSVGKSLTSTILGKMIDEGILQLDSPAAEFEPLLSEHYPKVTLRHFATMTSGYNAAGECRFPRQPENLDWSVTPYDAGTPLFAPGAMYLYWDEAMLMFGRVLTKELGKSLADYFNEKVGSKIRLERISWREEGQVDGITINQGCGMITMNALELARLGHLFLNKGRWKDTQIISEDFVHEATRNQVPENLPPDLKHSQANKLAMNQHAPGRYGFNWWVNGLDQHGSRSMPDTPPKTFYANGLKNNMCFVVPEWNLVLVRLGTGREQPASKQVTYNDVFRELAKGIDP